MIRNEDKLYFIYKRIRAEKNHNKSDVCEEWFNDFENFKKWALDQGYEYDNPNLAWHLQRKDIKSPYCPNNCFWRKQGKKNTVQIRKENIAFSEEGKEKIRQEYLNTVVSTRSLAQKYGVCQRTIINFLKEKNISTKDRKTKVIDLDGEIWKDIKGFEGRYEVSNMGRVKSLFYRGMCESILDGSINNGYIMVTLGRRGPVMRVHRLVAEAFIPNPNNLPYVNHKNEIRSDNRLENLEWCDADYNNKYSSGIRVIGTNLTTGKEKEFMSIQSVKEIGLNPSNVVKCLKGERTTCGGYTWRYKS